MEALRIAEEVGNAEGIVRAYLNLGAVLSSRTAGSGRLSSVARRGLAVARELGLEQAMGSFLAANLADGLFEFGEWEDMRPCPGRGVGARDDRCLRAAQDQGGA